MSQKLVVIHIINVLGVLTKNIVAFFVVIIVRGKLLMQVHIVIKLIPVQNVVEVGQVHQVVLVAVTKLIPVQSVVEHGQVHQVVLVVKTQQAGDVHIVVQ